MKIKSTDVLTDWSMITKPTWLDHCRQNLLHSFRVVDKHVSSFQQCYLATEHKSMPLFKNCTIASGIIVIHFLLLDLTHWIIKGVQQIISAQRIISGPMLSSLKSIFLPHLPSSHPQANFSDIQHGCYAKIHPSHRTTLPLLLGQTHLPLLLQSLDKYNSLVVLVIRRWKHWWYMCGLSTVVNGGKPIICYIMSGSDIMVEKYGKCVS